MTRARLIERFVNVGLVSEDPDHHYEKLNRPTAPFNHPNPAYSALEEPDYEVPVSRESAIYQVTLPCANRIYILVAEKWS